MKKILLVLLLLYSNNVLSKDFGVVGQTYPITEKDLLDEIYQKLEEAKNNGKIEEIQQKIRQDMINSVHNPRPVANIGTTKQNNIRYFDPSITSSKDYADHQGNIFYKANTRINPLHYMNLSKVLIFIDGSQEDQIRWALKQKHNRKHKAKIILVRGKIIELMRKTKERFYFDQSGRLTKRFGIRYVPSIIEQSGDKLRIKEVKL